MTARAPATLVVMLALVACPGRDPATVGTLDGGGALDAGGAPGDAGEPVDAGEDADAGAGDADAGVVPGGAWSARAALDAPRQEVAVVALRGEVVVIGGFSSGAVVPRVDAYDPATDAWRSLADLPVPLHHANAAVTGAAGDEVLVVAGFLVGAGFARDGRVLRYDPDLDAWTQGASMPAGTARGASGVAAHDGAVFVFGGLGDTGSSTLASRYDVAADAWQPLPDLPLALDHLAAVALDDGDAARIFIVGGRTNGLGSHTSALFAFDPATATYEERAPMPTSRAGFAAAGHQGALYVFGGEGNDNGTGVFPQTERYEPATGAWTSLASMRTPRHGTGAASAGGVIVVPGGADVQGFGAVAVVEAFAP